MAPRPTKDLTLQEARGEFAAIEREIGPKAEIWPRLESATRRLSDGPALSATVRPEGILGKTGLLAKGNTWRELAADCRAVWAEHADQYAINTIREMALAIITITADLGECTDAALRAKFNGVDVSRYGERAVAEANTIAANGPFSIVKLAGANDAQQAA